MLDPVEVSVRRAFASKHTHLMIVNTAFLLGIYLDSEAIRLEYEANIWVITADKLASLSTMDASEAFYTMI